MWAKMRLYVKGFLRLLRFIGKVIGIMLALDVIGLSIFQLYQEGWNPLALVYFLPKVLMGEGVVIALVGCILLSGYSEYRYSRGAAINPQIARDSLRTGNESRASRGDWGTIMLIVGLTLFFIGLLLAELLRT